MENRTELIATDPNHILFEDDCARLQVAWADIGIGITKGEADALWCAYSEDDRNLNWIGMGEHTNDDLVRVTMDYYNLMRGIKS